MQLMLITYGILIRRKLMMIASQIDWTPVTFRIFEPLSSKTVRLSRFLCVDIQVKRTDTFWFMAAAALRPSGAQSEPEGLGRSLQISMTRQR
ncbi:hypothetical protein IE00_18770 [Paracoccus sp. SM22M-07]|nr:hypothetical protein IE00_18770 [Paracoccus sp. SM22M-07]